MTGFRLYLLSYYITYTIFPMRESYKKTWYLLQTRHNPSPTELLNAPVSQYRGRLRDRLYALSAPNGRLERRP